MHTCIQLCCKLNKHPSGGALILAQHGSKQIRGMEFYIPSLLLIILAGVIAAFFIPQLSPLILIILCTLLLTWAFANHYMIFLNEYRNMNWINSAKMVGPYIMIIIVILLSIGYITLLFTSGKSQNVGPSSMNIPPPETATNYLTRGIGNSLVSSGMGQVSSNRSISLNNSAISQKI